MCSQILTGSFLCSASFSRCLTVPGPQLLSGMRLISSFQFEFLSFQSGLRLLISHLFAVVVIGGSVLGWNSLVLGLGRLELGLGKLALGFGTVEMVGNFEEVLRSFMSHEDLHYFLLQFQNLLLYSFHLQC
jgi:hypothetical protein